MYTGVIHTISARSACDLYSIVRSRTGIVGTYLTVRNVNLRILFLNRLINYTGPMS